jgi:hypothetical protein
MLSDPPQKTAQVEARSREPAVLRTSDQQKKTETAQKGVLPKGFFDDKEKDHKARGEEVKKVDIK